MIKHIPDKWLVYGQRIAFVCGLSALAGITVVLCLMAVAWVVFGARMLGAGCAA